MALKVEKNCPIGHFRVLKTLTFKTRLSENEFICVRIKYHFHIIDFAFFLAFKQRLWATGKWQPGPRKSVLSPE